jgi:hypothetical protein
MGNLAGQGRQRSTRTGPPGRPSQWPELEGGLAGVMSGERRGAGVPCGDVGGRRFQTFDQLRPPPPASAR